MKILLAAFKQETATFNPARTRMEHFAIRRGKDIFTLKGTHTEIAGALDVFATDLTLEIVPTYAAWAVSGGPVADADLDAMTDELVASVRAQAPADGALIVFHGAMAGETEPDPEGRVLCAIRHILGPVPIVTTFDLHAVITDRLVANADVMVPFHTYPHIDQYETGQRGAHCLLRLLKKRVKPATARVKLPMLVRGDELITATGRFGQAIRMCQDIEASATGLAAGVYIGNPFTDVPDLRSNVIVTTVNDPDSAQREAERIAAFMWHNRNHFVAPLTPLPEAIRLAEQTDGLTVFSDAADATSSGASGDSNAVLKGLLQHGYKGRALMPIVDPPAVEAAFKAGVGATLTLPIGGAIDRQRHSPVQCDVTVKRLTDGDFAYADGTPGRAGRTAVLVAGTYTLMATTLPVSIMDQHVFLARGLDPATFDLVVCKSPNGFRIYYEAIAARIVPVDLPGATSANLKSLPYANCQRPIFPLDDDVPSPLTQAKTPR